LIAAILLAAVAGCGKKNVACPAGTKSIAGSCLVACAHDDQCLLSETCDSSAGACTRGHGARPTIVDLHADQDPVSIGRPAKIVYVVENATSVTVDPAPGDGSMLTLPMGSAWSGPLTMDTQFTLTAHGPGGRTTRTVTVGVTQSMTQPTIVDFSANPNPVLPGSPTTIAWNVVGAYGIVITEGTNVLHTDSAASGSLPYTPAGKTTLTLSATNNVGTTTSNLEIDVANGNVLGIDRFDASDRALIPGGNITLSWATHMAKTISVVDGGGHPIFTSNDASVVAAGRTLVATTFPGTAPMTELAFKLTAGDGTTTVSSNVSVEVLSAPVVSSFTVSPATFIAQTTGTTFSLSWTAANATDLAITASDRALMPAGGGQWPLMGSTSMTAMATTPFDVAVTNAAGRAHTRITAWAVVHENDANDSPSVAMAIDGSAILNQCNDVSVPESDWYVLELPQTSSLIVSLADAAGGCLATAGATLELYQGTSKLGGVVGDLLALDACPIIDARHQAYARNLDPSGGPYFIHVSAPTPQFGCPARLLSAEVVLPECGNGVLDLGEECDDGNQIHGDGCGSACTIEQGSGYDLSASPATFQAGDGQPLTFIAYDVNYPATDEGYATVALPFEFTFFGRTYKSLNVFVNGFTTFSAYVPTTINGALPTPIPTASGPQAMVAVLWSDLLLDPNPPVGQPSQITQAVEGVAPARKFVITYQNVRTYDSANTDYVRYNAQLVLTESTNGIELRYGPATRIGTKDHKPVLGIENHLGTFGIVPTNCSDGCSLDSGAFPANTANVFSPKPLR
jgi:cysteine-rich repeat protein